MACCDWATFEASFLSAWQSKGAGEALIDWKRATKDWRRYHCTGAEAASMQLRNFVVESDYLWLAKFRKRDEDGSGSALVSNRQPVLT